MGSIYTENMTDPQLNSTLNLKEKNRNLVFSWDTRENN